MDVQQSLQNQHGTTFMNQKLDLAFIYFFQQFRKSYITETNSKEVSFLVLFASTCYPLHINRFMQS